jgi:predicted NBD/HSP70 family sugar kinase
MSTKRNKGKNLNDLLDLNRSAVLTYIVRHKNCTRTKLAHETGLTQASITKIIHSLMEADAVHEIGVNNGKRGRHAVCLSFNYPKYKILAIRFAWDGIEMQVYDFEGKTYGNYVMMNVATLSITNINEALNKLIENIERFRAEFPEIIAIGMAVLGPYYRDEGKIMLPPYSNDPTKRYYYPIRDQVKKRTALPVFIEHEGDLGALAYSWFKPHAGSYSTIMNIIGNYGLGIGVVNNGEIYSGAINSACELSHITIDYDGRTCPTCGGKGCLSAYCSLQSMEQIFTEKISSHPESSLYKKEKINSRDIFEAALNGDTFATRFIYNTGYLLGDGIISLLHVYSPDLILISGSIVRVGSILLNGINDCLSDNITNYSIMPTIELIPPGTRLTLRGALVIAIKGVLASPTLYLSLNTISEGLLPETDTDNTVNKAHSGSKS